MNIFKNFANSVRYFLWWSAGIVPSVLEKCPTSQAKNTALGAIMVFIAILASFSFAFFLSQTFSMPFIFGLFGGVLWGGLVFSLDRLILTSFRQGEASKITVIQRFILTISLSLIISEPLLMKMFEKEIARELKQKGQGVSLDAGQKATARFQAEIYALETENKEIDDRLDNLKTDRDEKEKAVIGEIEGISGSGKKGVGPASERKNTAFREADAKYLEFKADSAETLSQNKARLTQIRTEIGNETKIIGAADAAADGALAKHEALFSIIKREAGAALIYLPLFFGILFLETLPLSIKVFGKTSVYDTALEAEESRQMSDFEGEKDLYLAEKQRLDNLQNAISEKISTAILEDRLDNLRDANVRKVGEKIKAVILQKIGNLTFNRKASPTGDVQFGQEILVEVVGHDDLQIKLQLPENVRREITLKELAGDIQAIADEADPENLTLAGAFSSKGHEIWKDLPLLPQLERDLKLILQFAPAEVA